MGCAGAGAERNLAPLFSSYSSAGGDPEIEALGGMLLSRRALDTGKRSYWAVRPIVSNEYKPNGDRFTWFLPPLGFVQDRERTGSLIAQFLPMARYARQTELSGFVTWSLLVLPGLYWAAHEDGRVQRAFFPFFGVIEKFLSVDRATFALFPLWLRTERYGRTNDHFLWPFFTYSRGAGGTAWRAWPLAGNVSWEGRYNRWFAAWPIFHWQSNAEQFGEEQTQRSWLVWPLLGQTRRGDARVTTFAWPFFGHTSDPDTGFWAWDGPWPLVVFQGGDENRATRQRVWPFYSRYEGDSLLSRWYAWPLINVRHEDYPNGTRDSLNVFPFWRSYVREWTESSPEARLGRPNPALGTERWKKLWPLGKVRTAPGEQDLHVIDLNPFQEVRFIDEHYAWMWELYTRHAKGDSVRSRSWLGLWRREKDADEDRRALGPLWGARDYVRAGRRTRERSWLFGLLRYRTIEGEGTSLLRPAFPGPGWPIRRTPASQIPGSQIPAASTTEASLSPAVASPATPMMRIDG